LWMMLPIVRQSLRNAAIARRSVHQIGTAVVLTHGVRSAVRARVTAGLAMFGDRWWWWLITTAGGTSWWLFGQTRARLSKAKEGPATSVAVVLLLLLRIVANNRGRSVVSSTIRR